MREDTHSNFVLCATCQGLYGDRPSPGFATPQRCRCRHVDEPKWPRHDFNEHLHLCECCRLVPLRSGSRWSVWFCDECKARVRDLNHVLGRYVIPIGRHSLMGGIAIAGAELAHADQRRRDELIDRFSIQAGGLYESLDRLNAFAADRTVFLTGAVGLDVTRDVRLAVWLKRVRPLADAEPNEFGKEGAFEALVRRFASD
jgi:hypothetical protein